MSNIQVTSRSQAHWIVSPFLHVNPQQVYNPLTDMSITVTDDGYQALRSLLNGEQVIRQLPENVRDYLFKQKWIVDNNMPVLSKKFHLKYVALEANTACNQSCYFCPVSVAPRHAYTMSLEQYRHIASQLVAYKDTLLAVFMNNYNEPTIDKFFLERVRILKSYDLKPALLSNATGLVPKVVDQLIAMDGLPYMTINLSTIDQQQYVETRGRKHLNQVLKNLDYMKSRPVAETMNTVVIGEGDDIHQRNYETILAYFADTRFKVEYAVAIDRAAYLNIGQSLHSPIQHLGGCEQTGSRPLQHLHITAHGICVLCCQDYNEDYPIGDLNEQTIEEVLTGSAIAKMRNQVYGLDDAPDNFICRRCVFALER